MEQSAQDEQKEAYFLVGKSKFNNLDYKGAVDAYEKALEVNPRNASAHFELGLLYEQRIKDYAAAIYHYERLLKLQPKSDRAAIVLPRITACEQELAKTVSLGPVSPAMQRDLERLAEENQRLKQQVDFLARRLATISNAPLPASIAPAANPVASQAVPRPLPLTNRVVAGTMEPAGPAPAVSTKTYAVKSGDTLSSIARKHGVKLSALKAANPRLDSRKLHVGQTVIVPAP